MLVRPAAAPDRSVGDTEDQRPATLADSAAAGARSDSRLCTRRRNSCWLRSAAPISRTAYCSPGAIPRPYREPTKARSPSLKRSGVAMPKLQHRMLLSRCGPHRYCAVHVRHQFQTLGWRFNGLPCPSLDANPRLFVISFLTYSERLCRRDSAFAGWIGRGRFRMAMVSPAPEEGALSAGEIDPGLFRDAMRELAGGVAVITVGKGSDITGFTATSVTSLSAAPPRVLACVSLGSASWPALQQHPHFGVNVLRDTDQPLADRFAGRHGLEGAHRYAGSNWRPLVTGTPTLETALAVLDCDLEEVLPRYDHAIIIGRVRAARVRPGAFPLVYWMGNYHPLERPNSIE
jgi:flavin reductase (DIM6/NTAB) family NADH-FMN oxidoreductase RutF